MREFITSIVKQAGQIQRQNFRENVQTLEKGTWGDFLTKTDLESEKILLGGIKEKYPNHTIVAEESGTHRGTEDGTWYVDPLDGTGNFSNGIPFFCISVGFQQGGVMRASAVYDPTHDECFYADEHGLFLNDTQLPNVKDKPLKELLLATEIPPNKQKQEQAQRILDALPHFFWNVRMVKSLGSTALELAYVAAGRLGGFVLSGLFFPWDIAAGGHLIESVGGVVTDWSGEKWKPEMTSIVCAPKTAHEELITILKDR